MKALVTGATGLVGSNLVRALLRGGHKVRVLVRPGSDLSSLRRMSLEMRTGDILDEESLMGVANKCDIVFHVAAVFAYGGSSRNEREKIAVEGTKNVLQMAHRANVPRVVITSSSVTLGSSVQPDVRDENCTFNERDPSYYTLSKLAQERAAQAMATELNQDFVIVCPALTVGPFDYRLGPSSASIANYLNDPFRSTFLGGCNIVAAEDVAAGHIIAAKRGESGKRYVLGAENLHWRDVHKCISTLAGTFGPSFTLNNTASYLMAAAAESTARLMGTKPMATRDEAAMSGRYYWYSSREMEKLGYSPVSSCNALAQSIAWLIHRACLNESVLDILKPAPSVVEYHELLSRGKL